MDASQACHIVVTTVKASRLNFFLQESPFAITLNIKKTFIKNQDGIEIYPDVENFSCNKCKVAAKNQVVGIFLVNDFRPPPPPPPSPPNSCKYYSTVLTTSRGPMDGWGMSA